MEAPNGVFPGAAQWPMGQVAHPMQPMEVVPPEPEEGDTAHRPPNAFILYSQAMRSQVRQENPSLSNTEVSRLLGKMWKEVPSELKLQYKQKAAALQEEFKREHPDYTYRKARRKRTLNELLTKSSNTYAMGPNGFPGFPGVPGVDMGGQFPPMGMGALGAAGFPPMQYAGIPSQMPSMQGGLQPNTMFSGLPPQAK